MTDFLEIGPGTTLLSLARQCTDGAAGLAWFGSISRRRGEVTALLGSLAGLYQRGQPIDWPVFHRGRKGRRIALPLYPFEARMFWLDGDGGSQLAAAGTDPTAVGALAGRRLRSALSDVQFEAIWGLGPQPWLDDHRIYGLPVLPTAAGLVALHDAATRHFGAGSPVEITNLQVPGCDGAARGRRAGRADRRYASGRSDGGAPARQPARRGKQRLADAHGGPRARQGWRRAGAVGPGRRACPVRADARARVLRCAALDGVGLRSLFPRHCGALGGRGGGAHPRGPSPATSRAGRCTAPGAARRLSARLPDARRGWGRGHSFRSAPPPNGLPAGRRGAVPRPARQHPSRGVGTCQAAHQRE